MTRHSRIVVAAAVSIIPVACAAQWVPSATTGIATAISMFWISVLAIVDRGRRQLPDLYVIQALLPTLAAVSLLTLQGNLLALSGVGRGVALSAPLLVAHALAPARLGFGDVKAAAAIGAIVGLTQRPTTVAFCFVVAFAAVVTWGLLTRRSDVELGPFLAGAALVTIVVGRIAGELS